jgi:hypothetical protein
MEKASSNPAGSRILAVGRLDSFLIEFANAADFKRLLKHFQDVLPPALDEPSMWSAVSSPTKEQAVDWALEEYRRLIQAVWAAPDEGHRYYAEHKLRSRLYDVLEHDARAKLPKTVQRVSPKVYRRVADWLPEYGDLTRTIPQTSFEKAINRLRDLGARAKVCANPHCDTRFFIAKRKSQRYCDEKCSGVKQRDAKRSWWERHGKQWRDERQEKQKGKDRDGKTKR